MPKLNSDQKSIKEGAKIKELIILASSASDFTESDIDQRNSRIIDGFVDFTRSNGLLSED